MGSAKASVVKSQIPTNEFTNKKSFKHLFQSLFNKDSKKKKNKKNDEPAVDVIIKEQPKAVDPVNNILDKLKKLDKKAQKKQVSDKNSYDIDEEIRNNFTIKTIEFQSDAKSRNVSNSSEKSDFSEKHLPLNKNFDTLSNKDENDSKKKRNKNIDPAIDITNKEQPKAVEPVNNILDKLKGKDFNRKAEKQQVSNDIDEEIREHITIETIESQNDGKSRCVSNSSDSGFSEKHNSDDSLHSSNDEEVADAFEKLKIDGQIEERKKKKVQTVFISRGPTRNSKLLGQVQHPYRQINQINRQTFSGGQVIVNPQIVPETSIMPTQVDGSIKLNSALSKVDTNVYNFPITQEEQEYLLQDGIDLISEDLVHCNKIPSNVKPLTEQNLYEVPAEFINSNNIMSAFENDNNLKDFEEINDTTRDYVLNFVPSHVEETLNPVEEFNCNNMFSPEYDNFTADSSILTYPTSSSGNEFDPLLSNNILTPPRSNEPHPSPMSDQNSFYNSPPYQQSFSNLTHNSPQTDYSFSPDSHSPNNFQSDNEFDKCQDIDDEQFPSCVLADSGVGDHDWKVPSAKQSKTKQKLRRSSSSISMKSIKEAQKQLQAEFSKRACCRRDRIDPKKVFHEHFLKLSLGQRKNICMRIANMNIKTAHEVLHHVLKGLSAEVCEQDSIQYAMFYQICQHILVKSPILFVKEYGLDLLLAAAMRCPARPELLRLLVHCVRTVLATEQGKAHSAAGVVFTHVDGRGDNLLGACARAGDLYADVVTELLIRKNDEVPLFDIANTNIEGYNALHNACSAHNSVEAGSCLQMVHVLVAHGQADLYKGDNMSGDTALHHAVSSVTCDLKLVQTLFLHIDRKSWKQYAHCTNRSSMTPIECARSATKSPSRHNYPVEVLDMLKKCH